MTKTEACRRGALAALLAGTIAAAAAPAAHAEEAAAAGPVELTERQMDRVTAGAGKVSMNDFHFVMKQNSSSPGLVPADPDGTTGKPARVRGN
jgi:type VI protein secretion system component Hcp